MTGIDGFTVLEAMSQRGMLEEIPVIMISSEDNVDTVRRAFDLGASDYISRPFDARVVYQRITNTIRMYAKQRRLSAMVADQVSQKEKRSQMMIGILSRVVERRNGESRTHVQHISTLTGMLLDHLVQKTETYPLDAGDAPYHQHGLGAARHWQNGDRGAGPEQPGAAHAGG